MSGKDDEVTNVVDANTGGPGFAIAKLGHFVRFIGPNQLLVVQYKRAAPGNQDFWTPIFSTPRLESASWDSKTPVLTTAISLGP